MTSKPEQPSDQDPVVTFDDSVAGRVVEADGGAAIEGSLAGFRATFKGRLTGRRMTQGDPPWKWLELEELTEAPVDFASAYVWIDEAYVYFVDLGQESTGRS